MTLRLIVILIFSIATLNAKTIYINYSVEFGIVGEVAKIEATLTTNKQKYILDSNVSVLGYIANKVTGNLRERHTSKGHIENGLLVTDRYEMIEFYGKYKRITVYTANHKNKTVTRHIRKWKTGKKVIDTKRVLNYYGSEDMIVLFLNLPQYIEDKHKSRTYKFSAIGIDHKKGRRDVIIPAPKLLKKIKVLTGKEGKDDWYSRVVLYRKVYHSEKGELDIRIGKEGIVEQAVLKDLIFFGDIRIIRQ